MNLCRCDNGHFYDKEKYASCPHCVGGSATDQSLTSVFIQDDSNQAAVLMSGPMQMGAAAPSISDVVTAPLQDSSNLPIADFSADQPTVAMNSEFDMPTVPLQKQEQNDPFTTHDKMQGKIVTEGVGSEEDHTVAYFDNVFSNVAPAATGADAYSSQNYGVNKVSTPCVGWLIAIGGNHIGTDFRLKVGKNFIGRNQNMDIALTEDKSVSREKHAIVVYEPKEHLYLVQPGESSSLVYKNNKVVLNPETLEAYDMVTVGEINLLFIPLCGERFSWSELLENVAKNM
ncbi:MAG: FHA domain-containing protein [Lachnospiraceae bacterium]|nr:FHA domain-containing protein [Lachnospiraceae bacterium]